MNSCGRGCTLFRREEVRPQKRLFCDGKLVDDKRRKAGRLLGKSQPEAGRRPTKPDGFVFCVPSARKTCGFAAPGRLSLLPETADAANSLTREAILPFFEVDDNRLPGEGAVTK